LVVSNPSVKVHKIITPVNKKTALLAIFWLAIIELFYFLFLLEALFSSMLLLAARRFLVLGECFDLVLL